MMSDNKLFQKDYWGKNRKRRMPQHPVIEASVRPTIGHIKKYVIFSEDTKVLDVRCGNGFFGYYFSKFCDVTELDYSYYMLLINPLEKLIQADAEYLPFKDDTFDVVFFSGLLHHVQRPKEILRECRRVSQKFVVGAIVPNKTPTKLLPLFLRVDSHSANIPFSFSNVLIAEKSSCKE